MELSIDAASVSVAGAFGTSLYVLVIAVIAFGVASIMSITSNTIKIPVLIGGIIMTVGCALLVTLALLDTTLSSTELSQRILLPLMAGGLSLFATILWIGMIVRPWRPKRT